MAKRKRPTLFDALRRARPMAALLLAAVLLRAFVPVGWMPATESQASSVITICTSFGIQHLDWDAKGSPGRDGPRADEPCLLCSLLTAVGFAFAILLLASPVPAMRAARPGPSRPPADDLFRLATGPARAPPLVA